MKALISTILVLPLLMLAGCASVQEAYYVDQEIFQATENALAMQVVNKDYRYAGNRPEDLFGNAAEEIMDTYIQTYTEGFTSEDISITETGTTSSQ